MKFPKNIHKINCPYCKNCNIKKIQYCLTYSSSYFYKLDQNIKTGSISINKKNSKTFVTENNDIHVEMYCELCGKKFSTPGFMFFT